MIVASLVGPISFFRVIMSRSSSTDAFGMSTIATNFGDQRLAPTTRAEWWAEKIESNKARDRRVENELRDLGWRVVIIWECELRRPGMLDDVCHWIKTA